MIIPNYNATVEIIKLLKILFDERSDISALLLDLSYIDEIIYEYKRYIDKERDLENLKKKLREYG